MLKDYEKIAIRALTTDVLSPSQILDVLEKGDFVSYEYTGSGYFLKVIHPNLPDQRIVCDAPILGKADDILCGFIVFIENRSLVMECHSWSEPEVPEDFRDRDVVIDFLPL